VGKPGVPTPRLREGLALKQGIWGNRVSLYRHPVHQHGPERFPGRAV